MRMDAYLDEITAGKVRDVARLGIFELDRAIESIELRPSAPERAALLAALEDRIAEYGRSRGWMAPAADKAPDARANAVTSFIIKDVLGIKFRTAADKALDEFKDKLKAFIKEGLNDRGKKAFVVLQVIYDLCDAKTPEEAFKVLAKEGLGVLGKWVVKNRDWFLRSGMKLGGVSPVLRNRIVKLIAARIAWVEVAFSRVAWVVPWLAALDMLLTSEATATDEEEQRLTFLILYSRIFTKRTDQVGRLVESCAGPSWRYRLRPADALQATIRRLD